MAQRAPKGSMKQVLRPILIYLSPRSPNNNHQQPLKNDLDFGGLLRGMLRGYASGYASGVCFGGGPPPTNTYLGPREKNTNPYIYYIPADVFWGSRPIKVSCHPSGSGCQHDPPDEGVPGAKMAKPPPKSPWKPCKICLELFQSCFQSA